MGLQAEFLNAFARALSALAMYPEGHSSRESAVDNAYQKMVDLGDVDKNPNFSFIGREVVYGNVPLKEMRGWDWASKFSDAGVQRLEWNNDASREELEGVLDELLERLSPRGALSSTQRQAVTRNIDYGEIGLKGDQLATDEVTTAVVAFTLNEEADAIRWMHDELAVGKGLPIAEAESVVRALAVAMHGDQQMMLPLLNLKDFDEYTTTHCLNVSVLAMALAEWIGLGATDVRAFGVAGLMHDLGKVKIPAEILNKKGKLEEEERMIMNNHTIEGARIILSTHEDLDLAAVVAYEHHVMIDGGGYPQMLFRRDCHQASKLVHVCDVFDALRTNRPYRDAWEAPRVLSYIEEKAGAEFDKDIVTAFLHMMKVWEPRIARVDEIEPVPHG
ncbi:MAG: HD-GYP domain-containing protein [Gemmatimonadales bacterium]